jgi:sulfur carrier protein ThiS
LGLTGLSPLWERLPAAINDGSMVLLQYSPANGIPPGKSHILVIKCHCSVIGVLLVKHLKTTFSDNMLSEKGPQGSNPDKSERYALKIQVESLGLPTLASIVGKKSDIELDGTTVADLVDQITKRHGTRAKQILLDNDGQLDLTIQVMVNDEGFLSRDRFSQRSLKEGDSVKFILLVGGG